MEIYGVSRDAQALLMAYGWPGNVREVENVIQRSMITAAGERLEVDDFPPEIRGDTAGRLVNHFSNLGAVSDTFPNFCALS